jgi:hypothetical protein
MLDHTKDRADSPNHFSELLRIGFRLLKLALITLTVRVSFATFGPANADAATYVRISYDGRYLMVIRIGTEVTTTTPGEHTATGTIVTAVGTTIEVLARQTHPLGESPDSLRASSKAFGARNL